jgi:hypothetical protein
MKRRRANDGLNDHVWKSVMGMATAGSECDPHTYAKFARGLEGEVQTAGIYLYLLLAQMAARSVGSAKPNDDQLRDLAARSWPRLNAMGRFSQSEAEYVLRDLFSLPTNDEPEGKYFVLYAGVLLGELSARPAEDLPRLRPYVALKCIELAERHPGRFDYLRPSTAPRN